jgi:hypothetical protein
MFWPKDRRGDAGTVEAYCRPAEKPHSRLAMSPPSYHGAIDSVLFQFSVDRLREAGLLESNRLCAFDSEMFLQISRRVMLHNGVMCKVGEDFSQAVFRNIRGDEDEMKFALAPAQVFPAHDQAARTQYKREQPLDRLGGCVCGSLTVSGLHDVRLP